MVEIVQGSSIYCYGLHPGVSHFGVAQAISSAGVHVLSNGGFRRIVPLANIMLAAEYRATHQEIQR